MKQHNKQMSYGWLAGIFDGEGCVSFYLDSKRKTAIRTEIRIENTDIRMVRKSQEIIEEILQEKIINPVTYFHKLATRPSYRIQVNKKYQLLTILEFLYPYLISKEDEVKMVLKYLRKSCKTKYYRPTKKDRLLVEKIKQLKKKPMLYQGNSQRT